tara:strand:+ start:10 stop:630 length:621 start_codon:yes stop_codon:yes gene_type:complete
MIRVSMTSTNDPPKKVSKSKSNHYVDNERFLKELIKYHNAIKRAKTDKRPKMPAYLGECFMLIAEHLSYRPNFINYPYRDEMISDGVENCLQYVDRFDPKKSQNPFAYFTQIIFYAFLRRIQKEKKQMHIKYRVAEQQGYHNLYNDLKEHKDMHDSDPRKQLLDELQVKSADIDPMIEEAKEWKPKKKKKRSTKRKAASTRTKKKP